MSKIKPFWRIVIGLLLLFNVVMTSNRMAMQEGGFFAFAFWVAALVTFVVFAIRVPYDDPLRSMRDLLAQQQAEQKPEPEQDPSDADRIAALERELADLKAQLRDRDEK